MRLRTALLVAALLPASATPALADGAFPDSNQLAAPSATRRLLLSTTFGLVVSDDDGATWSWICEDAIGPNVLQYQAGAAPDVVLYAIDADEQLSVSLDGGRSWGKRATGLLATGFVSDLFADPTDPARAVAIFVPRATGTPAPPPQLVETTDRGETFHVLYTAAAGTRLESVEIAKSAPKTIYAITTTRDGNGWLPALVRTSDGTTWDTLPLDAVIGRTVARIASVDPVDDTVLYLRVLNYQPGKDGLAVVRRRGEAVTVPLVLDGLMSTLLARADGTLWAGGAKAGAFVSSDGDTFLPWAGAPHLRALAERDGALYAAADNFKDGFSVGVSHDGGATWTKLLRFSELCGIYPSAQLENLCSVPWSLLVDAFEIVPPAACPVTPVPQPRPPVTPSGCHCAGAGGGAAALLALAVRRRRRAGGQGWTGWLRFSNGAGPSSTRSNAQPPRS